jgi:hypothetical protein
MRIEMLPLYMETNNEEKVKEHFDFLLKHYERGR